MAKYTSLVKKLVKKKKTLKRVSEDSEIPYMTLSNLRDTVENPASGTQKKLIRYALKQGVITQEQAVKLTL